MVGGGGRWWWGEERERLTKAYKLGEREGERERGGAAGWRTDKGLRLSNSPQEEE